MSDTPFQSKDERSKAEELFEFLRSLPTNRLVAHDEEGLPFRLDENSSTVAAVCKRLEREQQRTLASVKGVGYKIVAGVEHVEVASRRLRRSQKAARRTWKCAVAVSHDEMSAAEHMRADEVLFRTAELKRMADKTSRRMSPEDILAAQ
jgi:hypothetical protein